MIIEDDDGETEPQREEVPYQLSTDAMVLDMKVLDIKVHNNTIQGCIDLQGCAQDDLRGGYIPFSESNGQIPQAWIYVVHSHSNQVYMYMYHILRGILDCTNFTLYCLWTCTALMV